VINNTKVFKARLKGYIASTDTPVEIFLIRPVNNFSWLAIGKPVKKLKENTEVIFNDSFKGKIGKIELDGTFNIIFQIGRDEVIEKANKFGEVPLPPYIKNKVELSQYQTSYAKVTGSVAAPTAGFHLTQDIRNKLLDKGVNILEITLHVGLGTFMPVRVENINDHTMHSEWVSVDKKTADSIRDAKKEGKKILAIGTTTVRTLEGIANINNGRLKAYEGDINIFIKPGYTFHVIDCLLTNFHLPKSTLLILISAILGRKKTLQIYKKAVENSYRFFSFGDAMLIL
jgi:S-adenosylmethionine:tRNA ribosyltransferase-isomerase